MARPEPKARPNFKTADFYAAFAKTLRTLPPQTPAAIAAANQAQAAPASTASSNQYGNVPSPIAAAPPRGSNDGRTAGAPRSAPSSPDPAPVPSPSLAVKPATAPPSLPVVKVDPKPTPSSPAPSSTGVISAATAPLEAEIDRLKEQLRRQSEDLARARADSSKRAGELEELKVAKTESERERNNLYKRITAVEKKLERGTHHRDGQKRHDRSQIAIAIYDFNGDTSLQQLQFKKGDQIKIKASHESGWWTGRVKDDTVGFFPVLYVQVQE